MELGAAPEEVGIHAAEPVPWVAGMAEESHRLIREEALRHLRAGKWVVALGGDHSVTHPLVQAHREALGDFSLLHVDAHADLYPEWQGSVYSHASPFYRLLTEGFPLVQVGIRAMDRDSLRLARKRAWPSFPPTGSTGRGFPWTRSLGPWGSGSTSAWTLTPWTPPSCPAWARPFPGAFLPPGGGPPRAVFREKEVVGMDFVELSPNGQFHAEMTAAQLVYHAIGLKGLQAGWLSREVDHI